jgi:Malectin domain
MQFILIVMMITSKVIAFEQIYAVNSGGRAHTDSDGIIYQTQTENKERAIVDAKIYHIDVGSVPASDKPIYYTAEFSFSNPLIYHIPLESDGLYVLIAKILSRRHKSAAFISMKLNNIQLISNADPFVLCGGRDKACDIYFYIGVADKKIYYENQSSFVKDNQIHVEFSKNEDIIIVSGLVMLRGSLGERQKLNSSATKETMYFDPDKFNSVTEKEENIKLQKSMENSEQSLKNISHMNADIVSSIESVRKVNEKNQVTLLSEIQNIKKEQCTRSSLKIQFDALETKIVETQQADIKRNEDRILEVNMKVEALQVDVKKIEESTLKIQAKQANMEHKIEEISKKLDLLLNLQTNTDSFIYFDLPEIRNSD